LGKHFEDEIEGYGGATAVKIEEVGQRLAFLERDDGQEGVSREGEVECGVGSSMAVTVFLPEGGIALVMVAVFDAPVPPDGRGGTGFLMRPQA
jgi:hypothetical protein